MKDVKEVLTSTRAEALRSIESAGSSYGTKNAWYYTHVGEIEMAFFLGLISDKEFSELKEEWKTHQPKIRQ